MPLHLTNDTLVHLAPGTYSWYMLLEFTFDDQPKTHQLITALLEHPRWHDDRMSPWTGPSDVHGPHRLETISLTQFQQCTPATARDTLTNWPATNRRRREAPRGTEVDGG